MVNALARLPDLNSWLLIEYMTLVLGFPSTRALTLKTEEPSGEFSCKVVQCSRSNSGLLALVLFTKKRTVTWPYRLGFCVSRALITRVSVT